MNCNSSTSVSFLLLLLLLLLLLHTSLMGPAMAEVYFSSLPRNIIVSASTKPGQVMEAGVDNITITWGLNQSLPPNTAADYKKVKVRLCYAPPSQADRGWRKTTDDLKKDKTCQFGITERPYSEVNSSFVYTVERNIPTATYFIRVYAVDSAGAEVAYGQTTDAKKEADLFHVVGVTGRHPSLDVAAACFSAFSVGSLVFFFMLEKRKDKK